MNSIWPVAFIRRIYSLSSRNKMVAALVIVGSLIALNVYTVEALSLKSSPSIPSYPKITLAYGGGNMMILITGSLGPYFYSSITLNGTYDAVNSSNVPLFNTTENAIYLAVTLPTTAMRFNSTALDLVNHEIYYFNASVTVNLSSKSVDIPYTFPNGDQMNYVLLGTSPLEVAMEGYPYA